MIRPTSNRPKPRPRRLHASSVTASLALHGVLVASVAIAGFFVAQSQAPEFIYGVNFEPVESGVELPVEVREVLINSQEGSASVEGLDWEPRVLPEPVHPLPDPSALTDPDPVDVVAERLAVGSEMVFGFDQVPEVKERPAEFESEPSTDLVVKAPSPETLPSVIPVPATEPVVLTRIEGDDPSYPKLSLRLGEAGDTVLRLVVDTDGCVTLVELQDSSGFRRLDQAAMSAAPTWRFQIPTTGPPKSFLHTIHFRLERR